MVVRILLAWVLLLLLAIINGSLRQALLIPQFGDATGHIISTILLSALIIIATWFMFPWIHLVSSWQAWLVGVIWLLLTVAFEFLAGHYLFGNSWEKLLADYNLLEGRIWSLVLITTMLAPRVVYSYRR